MDYSVFHFGVYACARIVGIDAYYIRATTSTHDGFSWQGSENKRIITAIITSTIITITNTFFHCYGSYQRFPRELTKELGSQGLGPRVGESDVAGGELRVETTRV